MVATELSYRLDDSAEIWQGTEAQIKDAGIGVGVQFPRTMHRDVNAKCPLGFDVRIWKNEDGTYTARSELAPDPYHKETTWAEYAPGVERRRSYYSWEYRGSTDALVANGVCKVDMFPGQPGRNKHQQSFRIDGSPSGTLARAQTWLRIRRGKGQTFEVEQAFTGQEAAEAKRELEAARDAHQQACAEARPKRAELRRVARQISADPIETWAHFREELAEDVELFLRMLWGTLTKERGAMRLDIGDGSAEKDELAQAFDAIREAVQTASIIKNGKVIAEVRNRQNLAAARSDKALNGFLRLVCSGRQAGKDKSVQSFIDKARGLRLVHSSPAK